MRLGELGGAALRGSLVGWLHAGGPLPHGGGRGWYLWDAGAAALDDGTTGGFSASPVMVVLVVFYGRARGLHVGA